LTVLITPLDKSETKKIRLDELRNFR